MGLHTGAAEARNGDYQGYLTLAQVQRLRSTAYGGQILLSQTTAHLVREMAPALASVLSEHGCSAVLESSDAYAINPRMDLTAEIIGILDIKIPGFDFNLEPPAP